ncbi:hypothetical protein ACHQM5_012350 [Ranunculus cassubicifolius]
MEGDWTNLPTDILYVIGSKLDLAPDQLRFRAVSSSWRSALPFPQPPWLILADDEDPGPDVDAYYAMHLTYRSIGEKVSDEDNIFKKIDTTSHPPSSLRGIVGIGDGEQLVYEFDLPEACEKRFLGSSGTWLITIDYDGVIKLLNPFSRVQCSLPPQSSFYGVNNPHYLDNGRQVRDIVTHKVVLFSSSLVGDYVAIAIAGPGRKLSIARIGDASWIGCPTPENLLDDVVYYKEQIYAVNVFGVVMLCDISDGVDHPKASILMGRFQSLEFNIDDVTKFYLVEWMGDLLMVLQLMDLDKLEEFVRMPRAKKLVEKINRSEDTLLCKPKGFKVYRLNFADKKWDELKNLGECSLFLGRNTSISVLSSNKGIKKNWSIYFTDDYPRAWHATDTLAGRARGVFDMETNSIQPHYKGVSTSRYSPPIWLVPTA